MLKITIQIEGPHGFSETRTVHMDYPRKFNGGKGPSNSADVAGGIVTKVSRHYSLRPNVLFTRSRSHYVTRPRQVVMFLLRTVCGDSVRFVSDFFGVHHSSVIHAVKAVTRRRITDPLLHAYLQSWEKPDDETPGPAASPLE
jgi:hypothetical protein